MKTMKKAQEWLSKLYSHFLFSSDDRKRANEFLTDRGINDETAKRFELGLAPSSKFVIDFLKSKEFDIGKLVKDKILHRYDDGNIGNIFQGRLVFPIH